MKTYFSKKYNKEFKIDIVEARFNNNVLIIDWDSELGFGQCIISNGTAQNSSTQVDIEDEWMGRDFVKVLLEDLVDNYARLESDT